MAKRILVPLAAPDDADALIPILADLARGAGARRATASVMVLAC